MLHGVLPYDNAIVAECDVIRPVEGVRLDEVEGLCWHVVPGCVPLCVDEMADSPARFVLLYSVDAWRGIS